jgi:hypothetical protein
MLRTLALCLVLCATAAPAFGADWYGEDAPILFSPGYLPRRGEIFTEFSYSYNANDYSTQYTGMFSEQHNSWDQSSNNFQPRISYGVTDNIDITANFEWSNTRDLETYEDLDVRHHNSGGTSQAQYVYYRGAENFRAVGADDPAFSITWRPIEQRFAPVNVEIIAGYTPDIFQARSSNDANTGSEASGGQVGSLQVSISRKFDRFTILGYGNFSYDGRRDIVQDGGYAVNRTGAHPVYGIGLQSLFRVVPWLALDAGISGTQSVRYDGVTITPSSQGDIRDANTNNPNATVSTYVGIVFPILPDRLDAEIRYQHTYAGALKTTEAFGTNEQSATSSNSFIAQLGFVFGAR